MNVFNNIIETLRKNLKRELPGFAAQNKMAPTLRAGIGVNLKPNPSTRNSAVLILIFPNNNRASSILIKRTVYRGVHSGQISFPGGKHEESDQSLTQTALREAKEEIGINPKKIEVIGALTPLFIPVSNLMVYPMVGVMSKKPELHLNLQEVEYTIEVGIDEFKNSENITVKTICINDTPISAPYYSMKNEEVWGATAMIISEFTELY